MLRWQSQLEKEARIYRGNDERRGTSFWCVCLTVRSWAAPEGVDCLLACLARPLSCSFIFKSVVISYFPLSVGIMNKEYIENNQTIVFSFIHCFISSLSPYYKLNH